MRTSNIHVVRKIYKSSKWKHMESVTNAGRYRKINAFKWFKNRPRYYFNWKDISFQKYKKLLFVYIYCHHCLIYCVVSVAKYWYKCLTGDHITLQFNLIATIVDYYAIALKIKVCWILSYIIDVVVDGNSLSFIWEISAHFIHMSLWQFV